MPSFSPLILNYFYHLNHAGTISPGEDVYFATEGSLAQSSLIHFSIMIQENKIKSARFECYGGVIVMAACEWFCGWLEGKSSIEALKMTPDWLLAELKLSRLHIHVAVRLIDLIRKLLNAANT